MCIKEDLMYSSEFAMHKHNSHNTDSFRSSIRNNKDCIYTAYLSGFLTPLCTSLPSAEHAQWSNSMFVTENWNVRHFALHNNKLKVSQVN